MRYDFVLGVSRTAFGSPKIEFVPDTIPGSLESRLVDIDGNQHRIRWTNTKIHDSDGDVTGLACIGETLNIQNNNEITQGPDIREIIENLHDAVVLHDRKGNILDINNLLLDLFKIDRETALSHTVRDFFSDQYADDEIYRIWDDVIINTIRVFEWKMRNPVSGDVLDVEVDLRKFNLKGEDVILGSIRDISKRKKTENDLKESEDKFKSLFEKSAIPQLLIEDGKFIDCNRKALDMVGYQSKESIVGLTPADISPGLQPDGILSTEKSKQMLADAVKEPCEFEWVHHTKNGNERYMIVILTPIIIRGKTTLHTAWIDINRRKHAEMTLLESEIKYKSIFEGTNDAILLISEERFIDCNMRALDMFGYTNKECFISLHPHDISPPVQPDGGSSLVVAAAHIRAALQFGTDRFEWMHRRANGELFPAEVLISSFDLRGTQVLHATVRDITARKRGEQALRDSEERYRLLSDVTFEGILVHDEGIARDVNLAFCNLHGYAREELLGRNVIELVITEEYRLFAYEQAKNQATEAYELLSRRKDGTFIWLEVMGKPFVYNGNTIRVVAMRDITERKRSEEVLRQSELRFRTLFESANESIVIHDAVTGEILDANKKALDLFACESIAELIPAAVFLETPYSFVDALRLIHATVKEGPQKAEWFIRNRRGTAYWVSLSLVKMNLGGVDSVVILISDITQRRLAEEALKISEEKFRRITESSLDILITTNSKRVIQFISPSISRYTGYRQVDLLGMKYDSFLPESEVQKNIDYIQEALDGKAIGLYETNFIKRDGTLAFMEMSIVPVKSRKKTAELEFFARDISDRKILEQEIIRACEREQQRIGQDLHDGLGQTLTGILLMLGTVARKVEMGKPVVRDEVMQIAKRVREAIDTTRQTARGLYSVTMEKGGLVSALREMAELVETDYGIRCVILHRGLNSVHDMHMANQLYFIAREAVNNALKHSRVKKITIEIIIDEKKLYISIENDGGKKPEKNKKNDGMGMKIMHYRANMIGALLNARYTEDGFIVELDVTHN